MSVAAPLVLREGGRSRLESLTRSSSVRAGVAQRARIVLLAADGLPNAEIARRTGTSRPTVVGWRARYETGGVAALQDLPRSGRHRRSTRSQCRSHRLVPGAAPHVDHAGVLAAPLLVEILQRDLGGL